MTEKFLTNPFVLTASAVCALTLAACAPKTVQLDFNNVPDNERCQFMKDVCKDAEKFQGQYQQMTAEERQDAKAILGAYVQQCEGAQELCKQTMKQ